MPPVDTSWDDEDMTLLTERARRVLLHLEARVPAGWAAYGEAPGS